MSELPSGTVTLLCTDIEGMTRLVRDLGEAYAGVDAAYHGLIRDACERAGGVEVQRSGDTLLVVFTRARAAVEAAIAAQRALAAHDWPEGVDVNVAMGIHTGEPVRVGDHYAGIDVNRTVHLTELASGGQVLVTQAAYQLAHGNLPEGVSLYDLGIQEVAGFDRPEHVYQVVADDLAPAAVRRRRALPAGTVTFLFTDIEGSAALGRRLRDRWADVHATHRRVLRDAFAGTGGQEVDTQGDSFFVAFARGRDAVTAAAKAQRALAKERWPEEGHVRVRMGIHTGEPVVGEEGYLGHDVVRAARICSAGHGGQVLLSGVTRALVAWDELDGVSVIDLGEHRLKGIDEPEHIYQLVIAGLQTDFRPLKAGAAPDETPMPVTGREDELAAQAEAAVRDFRTSIDQVVADSLRGVPGIADFDVARAIREAGLPARRKAPPLWTLALAAAVLLAAVAVLIVWLLAG